MCRYVSSLFAVVCYTCGVKCADVISGARWSEYALDFLLFVF